MKRHHSKYILPGLLIGCIGFILFIPFRLPNTISVQAKLLPSQFWILQKLNDGSLAATYTDQNSNTVRSYAAYQIERGDVLNFEIAESILNEGWVSSGDTIGHIRSSQTQLEISRLRGEVESAREMLRVNLSGEKKSVIQEAEEQLALSLEKSSVQDNVLERQKELYEKNLISKETYEIELGKARIYQLEATMALARKQALESGSKQEYLDYLTSEIITKEEMLQVLEERKKRFTLLAPLAGSTYASFTDDTLLVIGDTLCTALLAVAQKDISEIKKGDSFVLEWISGEQQYNGIITRISNMTRLLNGEQYFICTGQLEENPLPIPFNLIVQGKIKARSKTMTEYMQKFLWTLFN